MRTSNRAAKPRAPKRAAKAGGAKSKRLVLDVQPVLRAVAKLRRDAYVSAERRRIPITL